MSKSTGPTSIGHESEDTDNADTQLTSLVGNDAVDDAKSESSDTDKACYDPDSDRSTHSERSDGSLSGSSVLTSTGPFNEAKASEVGTWDNVGPTPENEGDSDIALQRLRHVYAQTLPNETQGASTALPSGNPKAARERKNASFQPQTKSRHNRNHELVGYQQAPETSSAGTRSKASMHPGTASASHCFIKIDETLPKNSSHNQLSPASDPHVNPKIVVTKAIVAVADILTALVVGVVMRVRGSDSLAVFTAVIMVLTVGGVVLAAL